MKPFKSRSTRLTHAFVLFLLLEIIPSFLQACPRCVNATPYKIGMQWAVVVLLPVPLVLAVLLFLWIRRESKNP